MESDPTERINSVHSALLGILQELPQHKKFELAHGSIKLVNLWVGTLKKLQFPNPEDSDQMELLSRLEKVERDLHNWCTTQGQKMGLNWAQSLSTMDLTIEAIITSLSQLTHDLISLWDTLVDLDPIFQRSHHAMNAHYQHSGSRGCANGTRETVLNQIECWAKDFTAPPIYWLYGPVGTGKTTIARTIADRISEDGQLGATFICSRDSNDPDRSDPKLIFSTLAFQLALKYPKFQSNFIKELKSQRSLHQFNLEIQIDRFINELLRGSDIQTTVVIIDALDELRGGDLVSRILSGLGRVVSNAQQVKFLITSRPESYIQHEFHSLGSEQIQQCALHKVELSQVDEDIQLFFKKEFSRLVHHKNQLDGGGLDDQLAPGDLDQLCKRAAGFFIYATAMMKFIECGIENPREQLGILLQLPEKNLLVQKIGLTDETKICSLYRAILQEIWTEADYNLKPQQRLRSVLGAVVLAPTPISRSTIATLINLTASEVRHCLSLVQSLPVIQGGNNDPISSLIHQSLSVFLTDPELCTGKWFYIHPPTHHKDLLIGCLDLMNKKLRELPDAATNSGINGKIDEALKYACRSWYIHLAGAIPEGDVPEIIGPLELFMENMQVWQKVLVSILHAEEHVKAGQDSLKNYLKEVNSTNTLRLLEKLPAV